MNFEDILYFDYKSNDGVTLNLNFVGTFLWYTDITNPVTFVFLPGKVLDVYSEDSLLHFTPKGVDISSSDPARTSFDMSEEETATIRAGIRKLLKTYPNKKIGKNTFEFDPFVMKEGLVE